MLIKDRPMKALLAYPPTSLQKGWWGDGTLPYLDNMVSLGSYLKHNGVEVTLFHRDPYKVDSFADVLREQRPDIVCLCCDSSNFNSCVELTVLSKKIIPHTVTLWGGYHATIFDTKILELVPSLDIVVRNEGEETLQEVLNILRKAPQDPSFKNVRGITYREAGKIRKNENRPPIEDMDSLPFLSYELMDMSNSFNVFGLPGSYSIQIGRGCSFSCKFCADKGMWGRNYRAKSPGKIISEIKHCRDNYPIQGITFSDVTFTANKAWTREICELMIQERLDIEWSCTTRIDCVDNDLLALMRRAGCAMITYGVESFSDVMLKNMKKNYTSALAMDVLSKTHALGIKTFYLLLLGFPGETEQTLREVLVKLNQLDPDIACNSVSIFQLQPGSESYNEAKAKGLINDDMWFNGYDMERFFTDYHPPAFAQKINLCRQAIINRYKEKLKIHNPFFV